MFTGFFAALRAARVPASLREYLDFLAALDAGLALHDPEAFYFLARTSLVKDERHVDRFDRVFAQVFAGLEGLTLAEITARLDLPEDWLRKLVEKHLTPEEKAAVEAMGGFDKLMQALADRLREQRAGTRAARSGSAPPAPRRSAPSATTPRGCASARTRAATAVRSRSGTGASSATSTTTSSSAPGRSRWRCGGCAAGRARAPRTSSTCRGRSAAPPSRAGSTW